MGISTHCQPHLLTFYMRIISSFNAYHGHVRVIEGKVRVHQTLYCGVQDEGLIESFRHCFVHKGSVFIYHYPSLAQITPV